MAKMYRFYRARIGPSGEVAEKKAATSWFPSLDELFDHGGLPGSRSATGCAGAWYVWVEWKIV